jgi:hypothetical protein
MRIDCGYVRDQQRRSCTIARADVTAAADRSVLIRWTALGNRSR